MSSGLAQTPIIKQGFDAAWARQPEQRAGAMRRDAAAATISATQRWTPEPAALEVSAKTDRYNSNEGVREYDATLAVPLWLPGERSRAQAAASSDSAAVDARLLAAQWRLAAEVREAYWAFQRARIDQELATQRLANARQLADDVARRVRAGDLARADSHQAEGAVAAAEAGLAEADIARLKAALAWRSLTGLPGEPGGLGTSEQRPAQAPTDDAHPATGELMAQAEAARRHRDLAGLQTRANPELTVGAVRERDSIGERYSQSIVVGMRIPLGTTSASRTKVANASAEALEAESKLALETERVRLQADTARAALKSLDDASKTSERRAALARETRGFFQKSFRLGESDLPTRLRVEQEAFEAERQAARSRVEVDAAISQLRQALGLLPE